MFSGVSAETIPKMTEAPPSARLKELTAYIVSDVHLNDHPFDKDAYAENPRRFHFREFLTDLNDTHDDATQRRIIILNGDIIDMTGSWFGPVMPWDTDLVFVENAVLSTLERIYSNNIRIFEELKAFLAFENTEIYYVMGNHDSMIRFFPACQAMLKERMAPNVEARERLHFVNSLESDELSLYVEHGHQIDGFNKSDEKHPSNFGDFVNIMLINRFVERVVERLYAADYEPELIDRLRQRFHEIEYLRPLSLVPLWIRTEADQYRNHPANNGKSESIDQIILAVLAEILDRSITRPILKRLNLPKNFLTSLIHWWVALPGNLPMIAFAIAQGLRQGHSNRYQLKYAQKLHREKGYRLIAFGHTHHPGVQPLSEHGYYFNTGSWKPVVNLFKRLEFDEANLEYLTPNVRFNKIEYSGILVIEKDLTRPDAQPNFSLKTIQSGLAS